MHSLNRRQFLKNTRAYGLTAALGSSPLCAMADTSRLQQIRPPELSNPKTMRLTNEMLARSTQINLVGCPQDWIVEFPKSYYLNRGIEIHGHDQARHIVIIGGGIDPARNFNSETMRNFKDDDWAVYALRGFAGAEGGTFRFQVCERTYQPGTRPNFTAWLNWDARPDEIAKALEDAAGDDAVQAVDGPDQAGGPWKIVPSSRPLLGRPTLDRSRLRGNIQVISKNVFKAGAGCGMLFKQWTGTLHCEGIHVRGNAVSDGIDIQNPNYGAVAQLCNVHSEPKFHAFHDDWVHPDGGQFYLGPSVCHMENVDFFSIGGSGFIAQPFKTDHPKPLEKIGTWTFRNCHFRTTRDDTDGRVGDNSTPCYRENTQPNGTQSPI